MYAYHLVSLIHYKNKLNLKSTSNFEHEKKTHSKFFGDLNSNVIYFSLFLIATRSEYKHQLC